VSMGISRNQLNMLMFLFLRPPSGFTLRKLDTGDAPTVNEIWPHRSEGSEEYVKLLICHNISVGACDNNGKLIAWCLR